MCPIRRRVANCRTVRQLSGGRGSEECIVNTTLTPRARKANYSATVLERSTTAVTAAAAALTAAAAVAMSVVKLCEA